MEESIRIKRVLLRGVMQSALLSAAPVWEGAIDVGKYRRLLLKVYRKMLLRVATVYCKVSTLQVIAECIPIDILVKERGRLHNTPKNSEIVGHQIT